MKKCKGAISLLLLVLYLAGTGGPALVSLSCRCVARMAQTLHGTACADGCCHDARAHDGDHPAARADWDAPCCGNHHSTEIELYTASSSDEERTARAVRCALLAWPGMPEAECPCPVHVPALRLAPALRPEPFAEAPWLASQGLRAPPVLV